MAELESVSRALEGRSSQNTSLAGSATEPQVQPRGPRRSVSPVRERESGWRVSRRGARVSPPLPTPDLPGGSVWPPIEGREILAEARKHPLRLSWRPSGSWAAATGPWILHSAAGACYSTEAEGLSALVSWARWHTAVGPQLSSQRCLALARESDSGWRLWQVVAREETLWATLARSLEQGDLEELACCLIETLRATAQASRSLGGTGLRVGLETLGAPEPTSVYVALAPQPEALGGLHPVGPLGGEALVALLAPVLDRVACPKPLNGPELAELVRALATRWRLEPEGEALVALLASPRNQA